MKYSYIKSGYHPKAVSFEVSAILLDEEKRIIAGQIALQGTILQNYNTYSRAIGLGFNPLTDQEEAYKQTKRPQKNLQIRNKNSSLRQQNRNYMAKISVFRRVYQKLMSAFSIVIQNMLVKYLQISKGLTKSKSAYISFLNVHSVNERIKQQNMVNFKYSLHPHVDALIKERSRNAGLNITK